MGNRTYHRNSCQKNQGDKKQWIGKPAQNMIVKGCHQQKNQKSNSVPTDLLYNNLASTQRPN
jgi:hypothetical protein